MLKMDVTWEHTKLSLIRNHSKWVGMCECDDLAIQMDLTDKQLACLMVLMQDGEVSEEMLDEAYEAFSPEEIGTFQRLELIP